MNQITIFTIEIFTHVLTNIYGYISPVFKQGRIHGNPVADSWAGAVMQKPLGIRKCDGWTDGPTNLPTDGPTDQHGKV